METTESSLSAKKPVVSIKSNSLNTESSKEDMENIGEQEDFISSFKEITKKNVLETYKFVLIIIKNLIIFGVFLLVDRFILWLMMSGDDKDAVINQVSQVVQVISAIVIGSAYIVRLIMEMYEHRKEILGISKEKRDK